LTSLGEEAVACRDLGLRDADDNDIWQFAIAGGWCVVTKDEDFAARQLTVANGPPVIWLRIGNSTNPTLFQWLQPLWPDVIAELRRGQTLVEVGERNRR